VVKDDASRIPGRLFTRWVQFRRLRDLQRTAANRYDVIVMLCYETISFAAAWSKNRPAILINHNNLDELQQSGIKRKLFSRLTAPLLHVVFYPYMAEFIANEFGHQTLVVPHPCLSDVGAAEEISSGREERRQRIVFAPNRIKSRSLLQALCNLADQSEDLRLVAKGESAATGRGFEVRPYFDDYHERLRTCDVVLFTGEYRYRVSNVVYEAIAAGKPVLMFDCPLARYLATIYPNTITVLHPREVLGQAALAARACSAERMRFLREHGRSHVESCLRKALPQAA
jgi:glycosyltransferase involved in cell wall biosynthesis